MAAPRALDVLVVDDDAADSLMIEEALLDAAHPPVVHHVSDGAMALQYLRGEGDYSGASRPDLILLDLNMPKVSGHQVLAEVKADPRLRHIPIVVLTTSNAEPDITASYINHANAFVTKPIDLDAFEAAVREIKRFYAEVAVLPH